MNDTVLIGCVGIIALLLVAIVRWSAYRSGWLDAMYFTRNPRDPLYRKWAEKVMTPDEIAQYEKEAE